VQHIQHHETTIAALEKTLHDLLPGLIGAGTERLSHLQLALLEEETPVHTFSSTPAVSVLEEVEAAVTVAEARLQRRHSVLGLIERRDAILKEAAELKNAGQVLSLSHTNPHAHSHALTHSLTYSHTCTHTLARTHPPTHSISQVFPHTLTHSQDPSRLLDKSAGSFRARQQEEKRRNMVRIQSIH